MNNNTILYVCDSVGGGIEEYALRQASALAELGNVVLFLCRPQFPFYRLRGCMPIPLLPRSPVPASLIHKLVARIIDTCHVALKTVSIATQYSVDSMLLACYSEYLSPFWAPIYSRLAPRGVPIGTIAHDPVRNYIMGPLWWHRWSVRLGYSFVRDVFVHDNMQPDFGGFKPPGILVHRIPHGPFELSQPLLLRDSMRASLGFTDLDRIFLSFGQIRDGKNLDRFIRALVSLPSEVKLLVAGSSGGSSQLPPEYYQRLASDLGVAERCTWLIRYISDREVGDIFNASDYVLMIYSANFRSASGVMNTAVSARKPILGSSGPGPFRSALCRYRLGVSIEPDVDSAVLSGAKQLLDASYSSPDWELYEADHSWVENARIVSRALSRHKTHTN